MEHRILEPDLHHPDLDALIMPDLTIIRCGDLRPARMEYGSLHVYTLTGVIVGVYANLPYITDHEWTSLGVGVKWYEPDVALRGGSDGLDGIRHLLAQAGKRLARGGAMLLEIGWQQGQATSILAQSTFPSARVDVIQDYAGPDRAVRICTGEADGDNE